MQSWSCKNVNVTEACYESRTTRILRPSLHLDSALFHCCQFRPSRRACLPGQSAERMAAGIAKKPVLRGSCGGNAKAAIRSRKAVSGEEEAGRGCDSANWHECSANAAANAGCDQRERKRRGGKAAKQGASTSIQH